MTPQQLAENWFDQIRGQLVPEAIVSLAEYNTDDDRAAIAGNDPDEPAHREKQEINRHMAELLRGIGCIPRIVKINRADYFQWLENRENTRPNRAAYVGWITDGQPDNYTSISGEKNQ
jgi:hypothetical protein